MGSNALQRMSLELMVAVKGSPVLLFECTSAQSQNCDKHVDVETHCKNNCLSRAFSFCLPKSCSGFSILERSII